MEVITALRKYDFFLDTEYELVLGRKGKSKSLRVTFDKTCWFHVGGIHYLDDIDINQNRRSVETFYDEIMDGLITEDYFKKSERYKDITERLELLSRHIQYIISVQKLMRDIMYALQKVIQEILQQK